MVGDRMIQLQHRVNYGFVVFPLVRGALWSGSVLWVERDALGRRRDWKGGLDPNGTSKRSSEFVPTNLTGPNSSGR
jgi:hypothetical protein